MKLVKPGFWNPSRTVSHDQVVEIGWWVRLKFWFGNLLAAQTIGHELTHQVQATRPEDPVHKTGGHHVGHLCGMNATGSGGGWLHIEVTAIQIESFMRTGSIVF